MNYPTPGAHAPAADVPQPQNSKLAAALQHARYGFRVFPLAPNTKLPLEGFSYPTLATNDLDQVRRWWSGNPQFNIGISTDNLLVIDVDPRSGGEASFRSLSEAQELLGEPLPPSLEATTQGGGTHRYFWLPDGVTVDGGTHRLGAGLDVKSWHGYVVAPGSTINGRPYQWKRNREPDKHDFAEAPGWLIARSKPTRARTEASGRRIVAEDEITFGLCEGWLARTVEATEGHRNATAVIVANKFYDYAATVPTCLEYLSRWNDERCSPPLELDELAAVARSVEHSRDKAIGCSHPLAPGFDVHEIAPQHASAPTIAAKRPKQLYSVSYADAASQALDQISLPLIDGVLDCGAMSVLCGDTNTGKTFVMLDMAFHIAAGREWAGRRVRQGAVVYVAAEGGRGFLKRIRAYRSRYPEAGDVPLYVVPCAVDLLNPGADLAGLIAEIKAVAAKAQAAVELVVIDTLSRAIAGGNENGPEDMGAFVRNMDTLRDTTRAHVAIVHHTGKDKSRGTRGHTNLPAAIDTEIRIDRKVLTIVKQRDGETGWSAGFALRPHRLGVSAAGNEVVSCTVDIRSDSKPGPVDLPPHLQNLFDEIESELIERCGGDAAAAYRGGFTTGLANECAARLPSMNGRAHDAEPEAFRRRVTRMLGDMGEFGHLRKGQRGQWFLIGGRDGHDGQNQTSSECANGRGALAPPIARDQTKPHPLATASKRRSQKAGEASRAR